MLALGAPEAGDPEARGFCLRCAHTQLDLTCRRNIAITLRIREGRPILNERYGLLAKVVVLAPPRDGLAIMGSA